MKKFCIFITAVILMTVLTCTKNINNLSAITSATIDSLSKTGKYFNGLNLVNDTKRNLTYYVPSKFPKVNDLNYGVIFRLSDEKNDSRLSLMYTNSTLYSQADFANMPFEANFMPGDSLDKWVNKLFSSMLTFYGEGFHYQFIEKQSNMYIVKYYYGEFYDHPTYSFYKISNGVPISMTVNATPNYSKVINNILNEAKTLFQNFNSIKSYAISPNIGLYYVSIGSFKVKSNAENAEKLAKSKGFTTNITFSNNIYRVNIGAFRIRTNADSLLKSAIAKGFKDTFLYHEIKK